MKGKIVKRIMSMFGEMNLAESMTNTELSDALLNGICSELDMDSKDACLISEAARRLSELGDNNALGQLVAENAKNMDYLV